MGAVQATATVGAPAVKVFDAIVSNYAACLRRWDPANVEIEPAAGASAHQGDTARHVRIDGGTRFEGTMTVAGLVHGVRLDLASEFGAFYSWRERFDLKPSGPGATVLTVTMEGKKRAWAGFFMPGRDASYQKSVDQTVAAIARDFVTAK